MKRGGFQMAPPPEHVLPAARVDRLVVRRFQGDVVMKIAIANQVYGKAEVRDVAFVPRVGDHVDLWYRPLPSVRQVIAFQSSDSLKAMGIQEDVEAVVFVQ